MNIMSSVELFTWMKSVVPVKCDVCIMPLQDGIELRWEFKIGKDRVGFAERILPQDLKFVKDKEILSLIAMKMKSQIEKYRANKE